VEPKAEKAKQIIRILRWDYPDSHTALHFKTPHQILVATILSAQCTDVKVNEITPSLFAKYPSVEAFSRAEREDLEGEIRPTGFFRNKAKNILLSSQKIMQDFGGNVPDNMDDLLTLPGVARKTANIVLSSAFKRAEGIAVDTHVKRLAGRLGLSQEKDPDKIEKDLMSVFPEQDWLDINYLLVNHGRAVCQARKPRCVQCSLSSHCPSSEV
jgi:endonuclease-3